MEEFLPLARVWTFATDHIPLANVVINAGHGVYDKSLEILPGAVSAYVKDVEEKVVETIKSLDTTAGQKITALEETTMVIQAKKIVELVRTDEGTFTLVPLQDMAKEKKEALDLWVKEEWEKVPVEEGTCAHWQHMAGAVLDVTEEKVVVPFKTFCVDKTNEVRS
jgi:Flp pilus assembly CpaE family ATPase